MTLVEQNSVCPFTENRTLLSMLFQFTLDMMLMKANYVCRSKYSDRAELWKRLFQNSPSPKSQVEQRMEDEFWGYEVVSEEVTFDGKTRHVFLPPESLDYH